MATKVPGGKPPEKSDRMLPAHVGIGSNDPQGGVTDFVHFLEDHQMPAAEVVQAPRRVSEAPTPDDLGPKEPGSGIGRYFRGI